jgi:signal transduction histidine kinase
LFGIAMNQRLIRNRDALVAAHQALAFQQAHQAMLMRERGLLLAATNHDLRQPLMGVGLFSDLLKSAKTQTDRDEYAQKLDSALKEVDDVAVGIQQLSKIHEDAKPPVFETVKLDALLAPVIEEYRCRAPDKRITIRYVPTQLSIATHPPYLLRIVRNILANSVRYSHREGRILVGCRRGRRLSLVIRDNGPGFNQQGADVLFQPFQQFSAELPNQEGFGLGLYSVRTLADTLGIEVQLRSTPGQGSEFWIIFPAESPTKSQG